MCVGTFFLSYFCVFVRQRKTLKKKKKTHTHTHPHTQHTHKIQKKTHAGIHRPWHIISFVIISFISILIILAQLFLFYFKLPNMEFDTLNIPNSIDLSNHESFKMYVFSKYNDDSMIITLELLGLYFKTGCIMTYALWSHHVTYDIKFQAILQKQWFELLDEDFKSIQNNNFYFKYRNWIGNSYKTFWVQKHQT